MSRHQQACCDTNPTKPGRNTALPGSGRARLAPVSWACASAVARAQHLCRGRALALSCELSTCVVGMLWHCRACYYTHSLPTMRARPAHTQPPMSRHHLLYRNLVLEMGSSLFQFLLCIFLFLFFCSTHVKPQEINPISTRLRNHGKLTQNVYITQNELIYNLYLITNYTKLGLLPRIYKIQKTRPSLAISSPLRPRMRLIPKCTFSTCNGGSHDGVSNAQ